VHQVGSAPHDPSPLQEAHSAPNTVYPSSERFGRLQRKGHPPRRQLL